MSAGDGRRDGDWLESLAEVAGPWVEAARAFAARMGTSPLPNGPDGIRALTQLVDAHSREEPFDDESERRFIDGAGATLGVLLLHHCGEGRCLGDEQPGWMAIGARGVFHPFSAIEEAIDSETPRRVLRDQVLRAEAEAEGRGRCARTVLLFEELLRLARPELVVVERRGLQIALGDGVEVDLSRAAAVGDDAEEDAREGAVAAIVRQIPGGDDDRRGATDWEEASRRLLPRLVSRSFLDELARYNGAGALYATPLAADVHIALILSYPGRARFVRADEVAGWGRTEDELRDAMLRRLAARSQQASFAAVETDAGVMVVARTGDGLDATRLLLPGLLGVLEREIEPPIVAAVPHRDALLAVSAGSPAMLRALAHRARQDALLAQHAISSELFEVRGRGVRAYPR